MFMKGKVEANSSSGFLSISFHWPVWKASMTDHIKLSWNKPFLKVILLVRDSVPVMILNLIAST